MHCCSKPAESHLKQPPLFMADMHGGVGAADAGTLFGGGGFLSTQSNRADAFGSSQVGQKSGTRSSGLIPLTVKQISQSIQNSTDDNLSVDGQTVTNITLVGMLFSKEEKLTDISFVLDDGTGRVEVKRWIDSPDAPDTIALRRIEQGEYVRVHGHIRTFQNKKSIVAFSVRPITDFNEVTFHFLECISVHLQNCKSQYVVPSSFGAASGSVERNVKQPTVSHPASGVTNGSLERNGNQPIVSHPASGVTNGSVSECQRRVQAIFEEPANLAIEQGLHVDEVVRRMAGFSRKQVLDAIERLVNDGFVYSTIDEDHFKSVNA